MKLQIQSLLLAGLVLIMSSCNENLNPPVAEDQEFTIDENSPAGSIVGVVIAYELDEGQMVIFEIAAGNNDGIFRIDSLTGLISVVDPEMLDYEVHADIDLTVAVSDNHSREPMETAITVTVHLVDLNEFAPVMEDQQFEITEHPSGGDQIGIIQASDQEAHQDLDFRILTGNEEEIVELESETGLLSVKDTAVFDYDLNQQFDLSVEVRDLHIDSKTDTALVSVVILDSQD